MRADLPRGVAAAMIAHAAGESAGANLPSDTHVVVLAARDRDHLQAWEKRLCDRGVKFIAIREPDPPYSGEIMALGFPPGTKEDLRRHLSELPLLR